MKYLLIVLFAMYSVNSISQTESISFGNRLLVGKIKKQKPKLVINREKFIDAMNKEFYEGKPVLDDVDILERYTLGSDKLKYYCVEFSSSKRKDLHIVRWLYNYDGMLYFDKSDKPDIYTYTELFITCEGNEKCRPRLFYLGKDELSWGCREFAGCVIHEEALSNKCSQSSTGF